MTRIGEMRDRVTVQQRSTGVGAVTWSTLATIWAAVAARSAAEGQQTEAIRSTVNYDVEIQYRTDVTPAHRLSWTPYRGSAKTLQILGVRLVPGRPERMLLDCAEVA